ncbi:MAG: chorismate-binding protein [Thermoanaerobaculia bacterium]|nr:chorismate-binding protein [Thermoanaerobaculia bacterium]
MHGPRLHLLGDSRFGPAGWWVFDAPHAELVASTVQEVVEVMAEVDRATRAQGRWAAGFVAYEAAPAWEPRAAVRKASDSRPLAWFGIFDPPRPAAPPPIPTAFSPLELEPELDGDAHGAAIAAIHQAIARGDTYQANFSYRLRGAFRGSATELFGQLVHAQRSPYSCLLEHPDWALVSVSPELFFERLGTAITCRPMKGTTRRGRNLAEDHELARVLTRSPKERAENLMIVDMVRNDLGRIARPGSVAVPRLFAVERFATVSQMISEVTAETSAELPELFRALFPCASITGAPKLATMALLAELERSPRGAYTGALGFVAPGGNCRFSVGIRSAWLDRRTATLEYGTGGGIVWDSRADAELAETRLKARVLAPAPPPFELLETLRWQPGEGFVLLTRHLDRMTESAEYFLRPFDRTAALGALEAAVTPLPDRVLVVRLLLDAVGRLRTTTQPPTGSPRRWRVRFAREPVAADDPFLHHKTTLRDVYEAALHSAPGADEVLLWNAAGEVTEGTRTNLAVELDGQLWTPPLSCGLLPGCLRAEALARGRLRERVLHREDVLGARRVYLFNSVRGWRRAVVTQ